MLCTTIKRRLLSGLLQASGCLVERLRRRGQDAGTARIARAPDIFGRPSSFPSLRCAYSNLVGGLRTSGNPDAHPQLTPCLHLVGSVKVLPSLFFSTSPLTTCFGPRARERLPRVQSNYGCEERGESEHEPGS